MLTVATVVNLGGYSVW